ncbi:MAG: hypothetical protein GF329_06775 [Candidatus Lokiarchaeota archaeon]|nr:hypothetical protein [Candidatus Lokiarchaeota archaeon]
MKIIQNVELYFETNEIEELSELINEKDIEIIHGLKEENWGQRTIRIYDPDKFIIEIAEPMSNVIIRYYKSGKSLEKISKKTQMPLNTIKTILLKKINANY